MRKRKFFVLAIIVVSILLSTFALYFYQVFTTPNVQIDKEDSYILIPRGATFKTVQDSLKKGDYVKDLVAFSFLAKLLDYDENVKPGRYRLSKNMSNLAAVRKLRSGLQEPVNLTFNNIRLKNELAEKICRNVEAREEEFMALLEDSEFLKQYGFNNDNIMTMFIPNTYEVFWTTDAKELFERYLHDIFERGPVETTIGEQVTLQRGFDITKAQQTNGPIPVVSSGGIKSFHDTAMVSGPGVVIGRKGTLGKAFYLDQDFWPHDTTLWVKNFNGNEPKFVYYFFRSFNVTHLDSGAANPALNRNILHPIKIKWQPVGVQKQIIDRLDFFYQETERLQLLYQQKLNDLEELKKSILQKAFTGELTAATKTLLA